MCGDMNVNGSVIDKKLLKYANLIERQPMYNLALDDFGQEHGVMMDVLSNYDDDGIIDVLR